MNQLLPAAIGLAAVVVLPLAANADETTSVDDATAIPVSAAAADPSGALNFEPPQSRSTPASTPNEAASPAEAPPASTPGRSIAPTPASPQSGDDLFAGGSESLVARTVGAAEGTRTADGGKTANYQGHVDPGNGVWNRGTFSYQFGNEENLSAEEADRRQLAKIQRIHESTMLPQAKQQGIDPLTLAEEINGIDLINQAPLAVTEEGGYIERLAQAKKEKGLTGEAAILEARVWAFWDAQKGGWDAPGLRAYDDVSKEESIRRDQDRRMGMISKALDSYERQNKNVARSREGKSDTIAALPPQSSTPDNIANSIIFGKSQ